MEKQKLSNPLDMMEREQRADEELLELVKKLMEGDDLRELVDVNIVEGLALTNEANKGNERR